jgi:hypothetical protein
MSGNNVSRNEQRNRYIGIGMAICMPTFALVGILLCIITDNLGLMGLGPAIGLALGIAIGEGLYRRSRETEAN